MRPVFTTTQFLLVLAINLCFLMVLGAHYFSESVRTVTVEKDVPVVKIQKQIVRNCANTVTKIVTKTQQVCNTSNSYDQMMTTAFNACHNNQSESYSNLASFSIDNNGKPQFKCE